MSQHDRTCAIEPKCQECFPTGNEVVAPKSKALGSNPKDLLGSKKVDYAKVPPVATAWESLAMMDGAGKYGAYNWRGNKVIASIYVAAAMRHLLQWFEGERCAEDSGCHHLGHARACMGILLDAEATGNLIDDRPVNESSVGALAKVFAEIESKIPAMNERHKKFHEAKAAKAKADDRTLFGVSAVVADRVIPRISLEPDSPAWVRVIGTDWSISCNLPCDTYGTCACDPSSKLNAVYLSGKLREAVDSGLVKRN